MRLFRCALLCSEVLFHLLFFFWGDGKYSAYICAVSARCGYNELVLITSRLYHPFNFVIMRFNCVWLCSKFNNNAASIATNRKIIA